MSKFSLAPQDTKHVYCIQQLYMELYINRVNHAPGIQNDTTLGVISSHKPPMEKNNNKQTKTVTKQHTQKHFFSETTWLRSFIFVCSKNPANRATGVHTGNALGASDGTIPIQIKMTNTKKQIQSIPINFMGLSTIKGQFDNCGIVLKSARFSGVLPTFVQ